MTCKEIRTSISAYLDGELSEKEARGVRAHLRDCPECARAREELVALNDLLDEGPGVSVGASFTDSVLAEIQSKSTESVVTRLRRSIWKPVSRWAVAAALAAALLIGSMLAWHASPEIQSPPPVSEQRVVTEQFGLDAFHDLPEGSVGGAYVKVAWPQDGDER